MKKICLGLLVLSLAVPVKSAIIGKLDLSPDFDSILARDYTDGFWQAGAGKPVFDLIDTKDNQTKLYLQAEYLHGINGGNQSAGLTIGVPIGDLGTVVQNLMNAANQNGPQVTLPSWTSQLGNAVSIEIGGGYNFLPEFQYVKPWFATVGAVVKIPIGSGAKL